MIIAVKRNYGFLKEDETYGKDTCYIFFKKWRKLRRW